MARVNEGSQFYATCHPHVHALLDYSRSVKVNLGKKVS